MQRKSWNLNVMTETNIRCCTSTFIRNQFSFGYFCYLQSLLLKINANGQSLTLILGLLSWRDRLDTDFIITGTKKRWRKMKMKSVHLPPCKRKMGWCFLVQWSFLGFHSKAKTPTTTTKMSLEFFCTNEETGELFQKATGKKCLQTALPTQSKTPEALRLAYTQSEGVYSIVRFCQGGSDLYT